MKLAFPFSAVVGQEDLKLALLLVAVDPGIGGVLIAGERGTAKSTAARGLAALLPKTRDGKSAPFVELPLGATEDRVVGSLDISRALREGATELRSGLLARADGGVLYVDEVNLLPDHIVDLLLDAAANGWVTIERDGISNREAARFLLVGTMNPEEGELRPQFVDRFGLCVRVVGLDQQDVRMAAIRQRLSFDDDPAGVLEAAKPAEEALRRGIVAARARLGELAVTDDHLRRVAALCADYGLDGIRGDLAIIKAARALAAWQDARAIGEEHVRRAADLALSHRMRPKKTKTRPRSSSAAPDPEHRAVAQREAAPEPNAPHPLEKPRLQPAPAAPDRGPIRVITDLIDRERAGRRGMEAISPKRIVGTVPYELTGSLAVAQTLTAAAQRGVRVGERGLALDESDLKQHRRSGPGSSHVLFLVDASGSMATNRRLQMAKGAALSLLTSAYQRRDEVALMVFRAQCTDLVLPFTRDIATIERTLLDVPTGGRTPLARALSDAATLSQTRDPTLVVLFTDGRANVSTDGGDPWAEALSMCASLRAASAGALVVDCEAGPIVLGRAGIIARELGAECVALDALDTPALALRINRRLETL
jgi:magnesium chelatase subunit D